MVATSLLAIAVAAAGLYLRFEATMRSYREETLQSEAHLISRLIGQAQPGAAIQATIDQILRSQDANGIYTLSDKSNHVIASSNSSSTPIWAIDPSKSEEFFVRADRTLEEALYGITVRTTYLSQLAYFQIAFPQPDMFFDSILADFVLDIGWIWLPFVIGLILLNLLIVKSAIRPLRRAVVQAEAIGPHRSDQLLDEQGLPSEVRTLVASVNRAIVRMNGALDAQSNFIADASHELRTPLAVLKAHAEILPTSEAVADIQDEIDSLARLVDQLLDSARLDAIEDSPSESVDLLKLSRDVAEQLAPSAVLDGKAIELSSAHERIWACSKRDYLFRALRNVVENALRHTPVGTSVRIEVTTPATIAVIDHGPGIPKAIRERIFDRFWQGKRDRSGGGAGLGMHIVGRTVEAMQGQVRIADAEGGGAVIILELPTIVANKRA